MKYLPLFIALTAIALPGSTAFSASSAPGELLVKYRTGAYTKNLKGELGKIGWAKIKIERNKSKSQVIRTLKKNPAIVRIESLYYGEFL